MYSSLECNPIPCGELGVVFDNKPPNGTFILFKTINHPNAGRHSDGGSENGKTLNAKSTTTRSKWGQDIMLGDINWHSVASNLHSHIPLLLLVLCTSLIGYFSLRIFFTPAILKIDVPLPRQAQPGWTGETLSNPSIQGPDPSNIQCYCPATGQLIDTVVAATSADVDLAIKKATAAQIKWRQTTFSQRSLVMKTLLKFILEHQGTTTLPPTNLL